MASLSTLRQIQEAASLCPSFVYFALYSPLLLLASPRASCFRDVDRLLNIMMLLALMLVMAPFASLPLSMIVAGLFLAWLSDAQTVYVTQTVFTACECSESSSVPLLASPVIPVSDHRTSSRPHS